MCRDTLISTSLNECDGPEVVLVGVRTQDLPLLLGLYSSGPSRKIHLSCRVRLRPYPSLCRINPTPILRIFTQDESPKVILRGVEDTTISGPYDLHGRSVRGVRTLYEGHGSTTGVCRSLESESEGGPETSPQYEDCRRRGGTYIFFSLRDVISFPVL